MKTRPLGLIPFPRKLRLSGEVFPWRAGDRLALAPESGDGDLEALRVLADGMAAGGAPRPCVDRGFAGPGPRRGLRLRYGARSRHGAEGYALAVGAHGADLEAGTGAGMYYGIQTLRQIARVCGSEWPGLAIEDSPALRYRGLSISITQGVMVRPDLIAEWVEHLASYKLNVLQLYMDGGFEFASHPDIDAGAARYTPEDLLALDRLCARHHIDLQPSLNSFGHAGRLLALPKYRSMAETGAGASFCPTDPRTYAFLADLYADFLPLFRSGHFNAGCDEVFDLGQGRSRPAARRIGVGALFANHVIKLQKLAARHGKRIQIWSDMARQIPEVPDLLPPDITMLNWVYDRTGIPEHPWIFEGGRRFRAKGFELWGAPGVHNWGSLLTRHYTAARNIRDHAAALVRLGGQGLLNTDWNEIGPPRLPGTGFHGYVLGAAESWSPGALSEAEFDRAFSRLCLRDSSGKAMEAIRVIGRYLNNDTPAETTMTYGYLRQPFPARPRHMRMQPSSDYFDRMAADIGKVRGWCAQIQPASLREIYALSAQTAWLAARKARLDGGYHGIGTGISQREMKREAGPLARELRAAAARLRQLWPRFAMTENLEPTAAALEKIAGSLAAARRLRPPEAQDEPANPATVLVPDRRRGAKAILSGIRHLERFAPPPYHHTLSAELSYDAGALHVRFVGREPDMAKYQSDRDLLRALGLTSYFEVFLAPDPARPYCYGHLTVSVTGALLGKVGAPFAGVAARSRIRGRDFVVDVRIPWSGLEVHCPSAGQSWRGNFTYSVFKDMEFMTWSPVKPGFLDSDHFGTMTFVQGEGSPEDAARQG